MLCGPAVTRNYLPHLKNSIAIDPGHILRAKWLLGHPVVCQDKEPLSVQGMSDHYRNCHFFLSFKESPQGRSGYKKVDAAQAR